MGAVISTLLIHHFAKGSGKRDHVPRDVSSWVTTQLPLTQTVSTTAIATVTPIPERKVIFNDKHYLWWREAGSHTVHPQEKHNIDPRKTPYRGVKSYGKQRKYVIWEDNGFEHADEITYSLPGYICPKANPMRYFLCTHEYGGAGEEMPPMPPDWEEGDPLYYNSAYTWPVYQATATPAVATATSTGSVVAVQTGISSPYYPDAEDEERKFIPNKLFCWPKGDGSFALPEPLDFSVVQEGIRQYCIDASNKYGLNGGNIQFRQSDSSELYKNAIPWSEYLYTNGQDTFQVSIRQGFGVGNNCTKTSFPMTEQKCRKLLEMTANECADPGEKGSGLSVFDACVVSEVEAGPFDPKVVWEVSTSTSTRAMPTPTPF